VVHLVDDVDVPGGIGDDALGAVEFTVFGSLFAEYAGKRIGFGIRKGYRCRDFKAVG